jgi:hypothetical protein
VWSAIFAGADERRWRPPVRVEVGTVGQVEQQDVDALGLLAPG